MPWTTDDYPASMKNFESSVRNKAIEIANALLDSGYEEGRAIPIAISQAKEWAKNDDESSERDLHVVTHPSGWAVRRVNAKRASFTFDTKAEARDKALSMGEEEGVSVTFHRRDGKIEDYVAFEG
jgi:hypothetical protein